MSGTWSSTSFFSFGPDDSFISKNFEGLRYRNLPASLYDLIIGGSVLDVYWASLGLVADSWILSFKDASGKSNLGWGAAIPRRLQNVLAKLTPSLHFRSFLGPDGSFIAWDPTLIRWANLPPSLEDSIQAWLTPSGWKAGPPRMVSWGEQDAFFALSEYGDVVYRLGPRGQEDGEWPIWKETIEEWRGEAGFLWSELAYISLDPTTPDQFIAIRNDGTWAGSIDATNEDALSAFAQNFFHLTKARTHPKSNPHPQTSSFHNGLPTLPDAPPDPATQALYEKWATDTASLLASALVATHSSPSPGPKRAPKKLQIRNPSSASTPTNGAIPSSANSVPTGKLLTGFPYLPPAVTTCRMPTCTLVKTDAEGLRACKHDVERLLRASGLYSYEWLRQERIRWHPDRFGRLCEVGWREEGRRLAEEMFKAVDILIGEVRGM
ncbi:hypothetical protein K458DRAFT_379961 [Lentithecium fluviatile CBS 122367]|uniref:Uncharacterized protein n=1 Tax=Lentithecium fluviatile CBS 122367 TaxID=1168545 RepID=A0A6G1IDW8_9PLEO|nr:hypothetical protein K458DRAFT_379961 [Lentithecium fluviatile CBS 122367]